MQVAKNMNCCLNIVIHIPNTMYVHRHFGMTLHICNMSCAKPECLGINV